MSDNIIDTIRAELAEVYLPEGVEMWLTSEHQWFDGKRAIDLIETGHGDEVLAAAKRLTGGAW